MSPTDSETASPLDQSIERAQGITTVLGGVFLIGGILQAMGLIQAGVPAWLNILIPVAVLALAPRLRSKSLFIVGILAAIFVVLVVDTLAATGYVLNNWGVMATGVVVVRYLILLGAAQELAQVLKLLLAERTTARRVTEIRAANVSSDFREPVADQEESSSPTHSVPASELRIDVGNNSAAAAIRVMSGLLLVAGIMFGSAMMSFGETGVAMAGFLVMPAMAVGAYLVAGIEERYIPDLIAKLDNATEQYGGEELADVRSKLIATRHRGSRGLAAEIVNNNIPVESPFAVSAFSVIEEIGVLDDDAALALRHYIGNSRAITGRLAVLLRDKA